MTNESCKDCRAHSGVCKDIKHLEKGNEDQWKEINAMKNWLIGTLASSVLSLIGIVVMLFLKLTGKSP